MSNPFVRHEEAAPIADVNVVPLADVSLVLLIILLVLSPMAAQSMLKVQNAAAKKEDPADKGPKPGEDPLIPKTPEPVLSIGLAPLGYEAEGQFFATDDALGAWLRTRLSGRDDKKVFLSPELEVPNGRVVSTIELLQAAGASSVALVQVVDPNDAAPAAPAAGAAR